MAWALILGAVGVYLALWHNSDVVPNPGGLGEWQGVPNRLRPIVRRGSGPVLIGAVAVQVAAVVTLVFGALRQAEIIGPDLVTLGGWIVALSWCGVLVAWLGVAARARRWRR
jgi:hypothetical protein